MIALAILGIGLLFIAAALPVGIAYTRDSVDLESARAAGDAAMQVLKNNLRISRQLVPIRPFVNQPARTPTENPPLTAAVFPNSANFGIRADNLFRPRHIPPAGPTANYQYPSNLEPREGNSEHPYNDAAIGANAVNQPENRHGDTRAWGYEQFIKVRPLTLANLSSRRPNGRILQFVDDGEYAILDYLRSTNLIEASQTLLEVDNPFLLDTAFPPYRLSLASNPPLSALERFFPTISPTRPFRAEQFVSGQANVLYSPYLVRRDAAGGIPNPDTDLVTPDGYYASELSAAADRRLAWTAFYRRLSYDNVAPGLNNQYDGPAPIFPIPSPGTRDDVYSYADNELYELIVVVTRRPSAQHRYARQLVNPQSSNLSHFEQPAPFPEPAPNADPERLGGADRLAPMPWLVVADRRIPADATGGPGPVGIMQGLQRGTATSGEFNDVPDPLNHGRALASSVPERSTFRLVFRSEVGRLLAPGSVLIPAANDKYPHVRSNPPGLGNFPRPNWRVAGFVPHMPDALPIYEVLEVIPDDPSVPPNQRTTTVVVKANGAYPWVVGSNNPIPNGPSTNDAGLFPFWIIPPSFAERAPGGEPIYDRRSPILGVYREVVRLPEVK